MLSYDWQTLYLYGLVIAGSATVLYALLSDVWSGADTALPLFLSPIASLSFLAVLSGTGYILTIMTVWSHAMVLVLSAIVSLVLVTCMMLFVIRPLTKAEQSLSLYMKDFVGTFGEVSITIPADGYGEVILTRSTGIQNMSAQSADGSAIGAGTTVFITEVRDSILFVTPVPQHLLQTMRKEGAHT